MAGNNNSKRNSFQSKSWKKQLPMWMTYSRMFMVPFIMVAVSYEGLQSHVIAAFLFFLASITDYYDGYFARKFNAVSTFGKLMDPIADKILVTSVLVLMIPEHKIHPLMVILILSRDIFIGGVRAAAASENVIIDAKPTGKWKTALQMVAIPALLIGDIQKISEVWLNTAPVQFLKIVDAFQMGVLPIASIGNVVMWISVILSLTSGFEYYLGYLKTQKA
jgi:CDP-diacylglycerol--glycerol-3-phosphate 3-phosphatidyltransferase